MVTEIIALLSRMGNGCQVFSINSTMGQARPCGASKELRAFFFFFTKLGHLWGGRLSDNASGALLVHSSCAPYV